MDNSVAGRRRAVAFNSMLNTLRIVDPDADIVALQRVYNSGPPEQKSVAVYEALAQLVEKMTALLPVSEPVNGRRK